VRHRALVVSDSGLERHRMRSRLRRAGLEVGAAVDPWAAEAELDRAAWDVVAWAATRHEGLARELLRRTPAPPIVLVIDDRRGVASAEALAAGFADVVRAGADGAELVARVRAVGSRSAAARALAAEAGLFRELAESGRDLLVRQGPDGAIRYASGAAREMIGWDPAGLVGRRAPEILPEGDPDDPAPHVHRVRRRDGGRVWLETTTRVLHDAAGRVREVHTDSRDVSERVRAEAERASLTRVTAAVAEGVSFDRVAGLVAHEALTLVGAESAAVVRLHGDEGMVLGAAGPAMRPGEQVQTSGVGADGLVSPVRVEGASWGLLVVDGLDLSARDGREQERLDRLAPLVGLAVANARARERLVALATTDPLTGLANHGAFHRRLGDECARASRTGSGLSLVLIDLDHFKRVNDTHGHAAGDEVLREVARRLRDCGRRGDLAARVGGEELAWLLPSTDLPHAMEAAERLRARIGGRDFGPVGRLTASLGVAQLGPGGPADLVRRADLALYRAKEEGRDACVAWPDEAVTEALFD
jgi:diguanylate cyclase (GGDEF)-like protein/PAS domain S-box-containing protein